MIKKYYTIALLTFIAGIAGNLIAAWIQQDVLQNLFTPTRVIAFIAGACLMLGLATWLDRGHALPWSWWWHRYWYFQGVASFLRHWERDFARLEITRGRRRLAVTEIMADGERKDLIRTLFESVNTSARTSARLLVLGDPGSGKSTGLERLTLELAVAGARRLGFRRPVPVLVRLGNYQEGKLSVYVTSVMQLSTTGRSGRILSDGFDNLVQRGRVVLLFDALDEALGQRGEIVLAELGDIIASQHFSRVPIVISSRIRQDPGARLPDLKIYEIQDLSDEAVKAFIRVYKTAERSGEEIWQRLMDHNLLSRGSIGRNPFWLQLILRANVFEGDKADILEGAVNELLTYELSKPVTDRTWKQRALPKEEQIQITKRGLAWIGYWRSMAALRGEGDFDQGNALSVLNDWLGKQVGVARLRPQDILELGRDAQIVVFLQNQVQFRHRLLEEFMTARAIAVEPDLLTSKLARRLAEQLSTWETLFMLGSILAREKSVEDFTQLVEWILSDRSNHQRFFVAIGLLRSSENRPSQLTNKVMEGFIESVGVPLSDDQQRAAYDLEQILGDRAADAFGSLLNVADVRSRLKGIELLVATRSTRAAELLVDALRSANVAEKAILTAGLVSIGPPAIEPLILGLHSPEEAVSSNVATALCQIGTPAIDPLIASFDDPEGYVRERIAETLGRIGPPALDRLIVKLQDRDEMTRWYTVGALGTIGGPSVIEPLIAALQDPSARVRDKAVTALGDSGDVRAIMPLVSCLRDSNALVQTSAADALGQLGSPALAPLMNLLHDRDQHLRGYSAEVLGRIGDPVALPELDRIARVDKGISDSGKPIATVAAESAAMIRQRMRSHDSLDDDPL